MLLPPLTFFHCLSCGADAAKSQSNFGKSTSRPGSPVCPPLRPTSPAAGRSPPFRSAALERRFSPHQRQRRRRQFYAPPPANSINKFIGAASRAPFPRSTLHSLQLSPISLSIDSNFVCRTSTLAVDFPDDLELCSMFNLFVF